MEHSSCLKIIQFKNRTRKKQTIFKIRSATEKSIHFGIPCSECFTIVLLQFSNKTFRQLIVTFISLGVPFQFSLRELQLLESSIPPFKKLEHSFGINNIPEIAM